MSEFCGVREFKAMRQAMPEPLFSPFQWPRLGSELVLDRRQGLLLGLGGRGWNSLTQRGILQRKLPLRIPSFYCHVFCFFWQRGGGEERQFEGKGISQN